MKVQLTVNGTSQTVDVEPRRTLADTLREDLGMTGTHLGCEHGVCGACTVLVDDSPVRSCLMFAVQAGGSKITTIEGLADGERLHPIQQAFVDNFGLQCGFCTPGFVMLLEGAHRMGIEPDADALVELLASNLCRCTGYVAIKEAAAQALAVRRSSTAPSRGRPAQPARRPTRRYR
ncbi:MAG: 2Fe-2S iron-sulfur cluster binding domain-containing protein [Actinobacteria bacterium]|nr:2Fe-2S iron-sulfur cluster binding domain-containing protein [Actinomycetota bacterium]